VTTSHVRRTAAAALLIAGSLVAISVADGDGNTPARATLTRTPLLHARMSAIPPHTNAPAATPTKGLHVQRVLLGRQGTIKAGAFDGAIGKCPKKFPTPVSGWFTAQSEKVVLVESAPVGLHRWAVGVDNLDTTDSEFLVGIVCLK
jgi:hypothetical protein